MKKTKLAIVSAALMLAVTAGCVKPQPSTSSSSNPTPSTSSQAQSGLTRKQADDLVATFEDKVAGTFKLTYTADYALDVVSESASAKGFARTIKDVTTIEGDFTAGNYYFHAKRVGRNLLKETEDKTVEALVWKDGDTYKYLEQNMGDVATLADEAAAVAKIAELMKKVSNREGGFLTPDSLVYEGINEYEHSEFLLDSKTVTVDEYFDDPVSMKKTTDNGIEVKSELQYVAYQTDGGVSELSGNPGANVTVVTNAKGYVTDYSITYNDAQLSMPIMTPAPVLHLTGTRVLDAEYGVTFDKLNTIEHHATTGTIALPAASTKGYAEVFTCAPNDFKNMVEVSASKEYNVGDWLCIKVTPATGNTVLNVSYAGKSETLVPPAQAGGYYCFAIVEGNQQVGINYEGSAALPTTATVKTEFDANSSINGAITTFTLANGQPSNWGAATAEGAVAIGANEWSAIKVNVAEGYEVDKVLVNGKEAFFLSGYYCVNTKYPKEYTFKVTTKAKEEAPVTAPAAIVVTAPNANCESIVVKYFDLSAPTEQTAIENGGEVPFGDTKWISVFVTPKEGKEVESILVNGVPTQAMYGQQLCSIKTAGTYTVVVNIKGETPAEQALVAVLPNANLESVTVKHFDVSAPTTQTAVANGGEVPFGATKWIAVTPTVKAGYEVESILVNGVATQTFGGMQCAKIAEKGTYTIEVKVKALTAAVVNITANANCEIVVKYFDLSAPTEQTAVANGGEVPFGDTKWISVFATPAAGYKVESITVNGTPVQAMYGQQLAKIPAVGTYNVVVTVVAE